MATTHLCFNGLREAREAHRAVAQSSGVAKVYLAPGNLRVDLIGGRTIIFAVKSRLHPPLGVYCACVSDQ